MALESRTPGNVHHVVLTDLGRCLIRMSPQTPDAGRVVWAVPVGPGL